MILGALVTHNSKEDARRAITSLRQCCDVVIAFDDGSTDGTTELARELCDGVMISPEPEPSLILYRRSELYSEAKRLKASWMVYIDDDEALSPSISHALPDLIQELDPAGYTACAAGMTHYYGGLDKRKTKAGVLAPYEVFAWKVENRFSYYFTQLAVSKSGNDRNALWHSPRAPFGADKPNATFCLPYPRASILHYGMDSEEKIAARIEWEKKHGVRNLLNENSEQHEVVDIPIDPAWNGRYSLEALLK